MSKVNVKLAQRFGLQSIDFLALHRFERIWLAWRHQEQMNRQRWCKAFLPAIAGA